jgi:hypothetical protein
VVQKPTAPAPSAGAISPISPLPNLWLQPVLSQPSIRFDWFGCLVYRQMAEHFGSSHEDQFGLSHCWVSSLGEVEDINDPAFVGFFVTEKGGLGYLNQGHVARFPREVVMIGTPGSAIEAIGVSLTGVAVDTYGRLVFIVTEGYRSKFGVSEQVVAEALARLDEFGALLMSAAEVLQSRVPLEVVWTVPAEQQDADDPQAVESLRPGAPEPELTTAEGAN